MNSKAIALTAALWALPAFGGTIADRQEALRCLSASITPQLVEDLKMNTYLTVFLGLPPAQVKKSFPQATFRLQRWVSRCQHGALTPTEMAAAVAALATVILQQDLGK